MKGLFGAMRWMQSHVSDEDLLLLAEGELPPRRLARVRRHLRKCRTCTERRSAVQDGLADLVRTCREAQRPAPDAFRSRARLLARLPAGAGRSSARAAWRWQRGALAAAGLIVVAAVAALTVPRRADDGASRADPARSRAAQAAALPHPELTPGAVRQVSVEEVCRRGRSAASPLVAAAVARQVFEDYGADYRRADEYELDFLITPELGGTADVRNLWPQPYGATRWNAYVKDELELLFRRLVCDGEIDISTAQREMATNWIAAYRRYFDTDRPRRAATRRDG